MQAQPPRDPPSGSMMEKPAAAAGVLQRCGRRPDRNMLAFGGKKAREGSKANSRNNGHALPRSPAPRCNPRTRARQESGRPGVKSQNPKGLHAARGQNMKNISPHAGLEPKQRTCHAPPPPVPVPRPQSILQSQLCSFFNHGPRTGPHSEVVEKFGRETFLFLATF